MHGAEEEGEGKKFVSSFPDVVGETDIVGEDDAEGHDCEANDAEDFCGFAKGEEKLECGRDGELSVTPGEKERVEKEGDECGGSDELVDAVRMTQVAENAFLEGNANGKEKSEGECGESKDAGDFGKVHDGEDWWLGDEPDDEGEKEERGDCCCAFWNGHS